MLSGFPFYQHFKEAVVSVIHLPADAIHIYIGFFFLGVTLFVLKKKLPTFAMLIPGFIFSLFMEVMDLTYQANLLGAPDWSGSWHDILNTNLLPLLVVTFAQALSTTQEAPSDSKRSA